MTTESDKEAQKELATNVPCEFDVTLDSLGGDSDYWAKCLMELSQATKQKAQIPKGGNAFVYSKDMIAWDVRDKAQDKAHKLRGDYKAEKVDHKFSNLPTMTVVVQERMKEKKKNGSI